jgi:hypothetical protein
MHACLMGRIKCMSTSPSTATTSKHQTTRLENSTYNILMALGQEAGFLYSNIDTWFEDAHKDNRPHLVDIWNEIKRDKQKHMKMLRETLEKEAREEKFK